MATDKLQINTAMCIITLLFAQFKLYMYKVYYNDIDNNYNCHNLPRPS